MGKQSFPQVVVICSNCVTTRRGTTLVTIEEGREKARCPKCNARTGRDSKLAPAIVVKCDKGDCHKPVVIGEGFVQAFCPSCDTTVTRESKPAEGYGAKKCDAGKWRPVRGDQTLLCLRQCERHCTRKDPQHRGQGRRQVRFAISAVR